MKLGKYRIIVFLYSIIGLGILGCGAGNRPVETKNIEVHGHFVNMTFLDNISDSLPGTIPVYCYEFNFSYKDSVDINFGFETARFGTSRSGDTMIIKNACNKGDLSILLNPDSSFVLIDSAWTGLEVNSVFKKSELITKDEWHFDYYLNEQMIAGKYFVDAPPTSSQMSFFEFDASGKIKGFDQFITYKICYSGDCVGLTTPLSNTIDFTDIKGNTTTFAFAINNTFGRHINLFKLGESLPDMKGEIPIKEKFAGLSQIVDAKN